MRVTAQGSGCRPLVLLGSRLGVAAVILLDVGEDDSHARDDCGARAVDWVTGYALGAAPARGANRCKNCDWRGLSEASPLRHGLSSSTSWPWGVAAGPIADDGMLRVFSRSWSRQAEFLQVSRVWSARYTLLDRAPISDEWKNAERAHLISCQIHRRWLTFRALPAWVTRKLGQSCRLRIASRR